MSKFESDVAAKPKKEPQPGLWILICAVLLMAFGIGYAAVVAHQAELDFLREYGVTVPGEVLGTKSWTEKERTSDGEYKTRHIYAVVVTFEHPTAGQLVKEKRVHSSRHSKYRGATPSNPHAKQFRIAEVNDDH